MLHIYFMWADEDIRVRIMNVPVRHKRISIAKKINLGIKRSEMKVKECEREMQCIK